MVDEAGWSVGWGLGLGLYRRGERVYVGHGGSELVLTWHEGQLRLQALAYPGGRDVSLLRREGDDAWRIVEGRERGELLRVIRGDDGMPVKLYVATYPLTRAPASFTVDG